MNISQKRSTSHLTLVHYIGFALSCLILLWFYGFFDAFVLSSKSALAWLFSAWNPETDYEHGWMVPALSAFMLHQVWKHARNVPKSPSLWGLLLLVIGALFCVLAVRTQQGRIAIGALPFLLTGLCWCYWGGRHALRCAFPFFFLWMSIPLPGFQQATVWMQLLATQGAYWAASLCGVETIVEGTNISSVSGNWDTYSVAGGCSGMRSLMSLIMISTAWGYLAFGLALWKRALLALAAIPLAIVANAFRVSSIFIFAEYVNPAFAGKTWHDWSGLIFFFPASMLGLVVLHSILAGELPFFKKGPRVQRRVQKRMPQEKITAASPKSEEEATQSRVERHAGDKN